MPQQYQRIASKSSILSANSMEELSGGEEGSEATSPTLSFSMPRVKSKYLASLSVYNRSTVQTHTSLRVASVYTLPTFPHIHVQLHRFMYNFTHSCTTSQIFLRSSSCTVLLAYLSYSRLLLSFDIIIFRELPFNEIDENSTGMKCEYSLNPTLSVSKITFLVIFPILFYT